MTSAIIVCIDWGKISADLSWTHTITNTRNEFGVSSQYVGTSGPYEESSDTGSPQDRGKRFFAGGTSPLSSLMQTISLAPAAKTIAGGAVHPTRISWRTHHEPDRTACYFGLRSGMT